MHKLTTHSFTDFFRAGAIILLILSSSFSKSFSQTNSFSGTIGKYPIYIQFTLEGNTVEGYYFYKNKLVDISLSGNYKTGLITLMSKDIYGETAENPEVFKFKWPNKLPEGTWTHRGKPLPLKLAALTPKETNSPKCSNPYLKKEAYIANDLTKVKIGLFKLKQDGPVTTVNQVKIRSFTEVLTGISLFRIDSGLVAEKQKDANLYLEYLHLSEFLENLDCASYSEDGSSNYHFDAFAITVSNAFVGFSVFKSYYCGGAHPDEENYGVNYDLNTKKQIQPGDYLILGKESTFEERIYTYLSKTYSGYFDGERDSDMMDCEYQEKDLWTADCKFTFTSEGLKLHPSFSHYKAPCLDPEWAVIPYSELRDLLKPEYLRMVNGLKL